jgi:hypothetical protein
MTKGLDDFESQVRSETAGASTTTTSAAPANNTHESYPTGDPRQWNSTVFELSYN